MLKEIDLKGSSIAQIKAILQERSQKDLTKYKDTARQIIEEVKKREDQALLEYTSRYDKVELNQDQIEVEKQEINQAVDRVDRAFLKSLKKAAENIKKFHQKQKEYSWQTHDLPVRITGQVVRPLERAGIYVPGGRAAYPSSVLMTAIQAKVAGVQDIIMVTPPTDFRETNLKILAAASIAGVDRIFRLGGAQAVAALAYGTETVPKVDIIVGPGNIYVTMAKELVFGKVKIDMTAGPSEILILADDKANPEYIAADLMSQAEHDPLASSILITDSKELGNLVKKEINRQIKGLEKKEIIRDSLINQIAPEHLELVVDKPFEFLPKIKNAGSIFLGEYTPEALGDYFAGPNHVLPTESTSRFFSPLSVRDFIKYSSFIYYSKEAFKQDADHVIRLADAEGLTAHANSVRVRKKDIEGESDGN